MKARQALAFYGVAPKARFEALIRCALLVTLFSATAAFGRAVNDIQRPQPLPSNFAQIADSIVATAFPADGPGVAVIVTRGGRTLYSRAQGLADVETRRPVTLQTTFRYASITKQFTAAVVLQLVAEGRISLDDPVSRFFPDYPRPGAEATVRQLLNHTSGILTYNRIPGWAVPDNFSRAHSTADMVALSRDQPVVSRPGQAFAYNNSGYVLLGAVIEQVTGKPWHQAIVERIARPLGLRTIAYGEAIPPDAAVAMGYRTSVGGPRPALPLHMSVPHAAGGLVGSVADLAAWANALHHGRVINPELYAEMTRPTSLPNAAPRRYGFGLSLRRIRGQPTIGHGGGINGYLSESVYVPSEDLFVGILANSEDPPWAAEMLVHRLVALALRNPYPTFRREEIAAACLEPLLGIYILEGNKGEIRVFARDRQLFTQRDNEGVREAIPASGNRYYHEESLTWFRIEPRPDGRHVMLVHPADQATEERAVRVRPTDVSAHLPRRGAPFQHSACTRAPSKP